MIHPNTPSRAKTTSTFDFEHTGAEDCHCINCIHRLAKKVVPSKPKFGIEEGSVLRLRFTDDRHFNHTASPGCNCNNCIIKRGKLISEINPAEASDEGRSSHVSEKDSTCGESSTRRSELCFSSASVFVNEDGSNEVGISPNNVSCQFSKSPTKSAVCTSRCRHCFHYDV